MSLQRVVSALSVVVIGVGNLLVVATSALAWQPTPDSAPRSAGDWSSVGANAGRTESIAVPGPGQSATELWRFSADMTSDLPPAGPLVADGNLYLWTRGPQRLLALDVDTGDERWSADVGNALDESGLCLAAWAGSGAIYVIGTVPTSADQPPASVVFALDSATGHELWRSPLGESSRVTTPIVSNDLLVFTAVGAAKTSVFAITTTSGDLRWQFTFTSSPAEITPVAADSNVVVLAARHANTNPATGELIVLDAQIGSKVWRAESFGTPIRMPAIADETVFLISDKAGSAIATGAERAGTAQLALEAFDAATGARVWQFGGATGNDLRLADVERVIVSDDVIFLEAFEERTGGARPEFTDALIAIASDTGTELWRAHIDAPVLAGGVLYGNDLGPLETGGWTDVVAVDAGTGAELWRYPGLAFVLAVAADRLIVLPTDAIIILGDVVD